MVTHITENFMDTLTAPPPEMAFDPEYVCLRCGLTHGKEHKIVTQALWEHGTCDMCSGETAVTCVTDFGGVNYILVDDVKS